MKKKNVKKKKEKTKKKKRDDLYELKTFSTYMDINREQFKIIDKISFESKNIYNHYMFCLNFYNKFKNNIYKEIFMEHFSDHYVNKHFGDYEIKDFKNFESLALNNKYDFINDDIQKKLIIKYEYYCSYYKIYKTNNNIIYKYIKNDNPLIIHDNFNFYLNKYSVECLKLKGIEVNNINYNLVFHDIIGNILITFYKSNYFHLKYSIINKKPFRQELDIESFKTHVLTENLKFVNDTSDLSKYYLLMNKIFKINSEQNIIRKFALKNLKSDFIYRDVVINIMDKCYTTYKSYIGLKYSKYKSNKPKYMNTNERFIIPFYSKSFKIVGDEIRLCMGKYISKNYNMICGTNYKISKKLVYTNKYIKNKKEIFDGAFMYVKPPDKIKNKKIKLIEIIPLYDGHKYKINYIYEKEKEEIKINENEYISIDLGMINLMAIYDPNGKQYLIKGGTLIGINEYFNKKIAERKSIIKKTNNKETCRYIRNLLIKRKNVIDDYFRKIVNILYEKYKHKEKIIIGYNEGWKTKTNMGTKTNRKFYEIPYSTLLMKMRDKFKNRIETINESYTSKTDSLNMEKIGKNLERIGERIKRGLYSSKIKKLINADINGAINIMRKVYTDINIITGIRIENPKRINIFREVHTSG
jgi:IS605 OrfB family transposase